MGFGPGAAPVLEGPDGCLWFHFGGSVFEEMVKVLVPHLRSSRGLSGFALEGAPSENDLRALFEDLNGLTDMLRRNIDDAKTFMTLGCYHGLLPPTIRTEVCLQVLDPQEFARWLQSRDLRSSEFTRRAEECLREALGWRAGPIPPSASNDE
jgi:hypothetical protein